jgi:hypothetical protein
MSAISSGERALADPVGAIGNAFGASGALAGRVGIAGSGCVGAMGRFMTTPPG